MTCASSLAAFGTLAGLLVGCAAASTPSRLTLTGSSSVAPLAGEIARRFEASHPGVRIDVQTGGSSRGLADLRRGTADIGMVSRGLNTGEADFQATTIALDGVAVIVNRSNPVGALSDDQVRGIFTGRIKDWAQLGGKPAAITVVSKAEGRSTLEVFLDHFQLDSQAIKASVVIGDNQQGLRTVAGDPRAIAYVSIGAATTEAQRGEAIRLLPMAGVAPTLANVANRSFPLARPLNLVSKPEATTPLAQDFLRFAIAPANADLLAREAVVAPSR